MARDKKDKRTIDMFTGKTQVQEKQKDISMRALKQKKTVLSNEEAIANKGWLPVAYHGIDNYNGYK